MKIRIVWLLFLFGIILILKVISFASPLGWEDEDPSFYIENGGAVVIGVSLGFSGKYGFSYAPTAGGIERRTRLGLGINGIGLDWRNTDGKIFKFKENNLYLLGYELSFTPVTFDIGGKSKIEMEENKRIIEKPIGGIQFYYANQLIAYYRTYEYGVKIYLPFGFVLKIVNERQADRIKIGDDQYDIVNSRRLWTLSISFPSILYSRKEEEVKNEKD